MLMHRIQQPDSPADILAGTFSRMVQPGVIDIGWTIGLLDTMRQHQGSAGIACEDPPHGLLFFLTPQPRYLVFNHLCLAYLCYGCNTNRKYSPNGILPTAPSRRHQSRCVLQLRLPEARSLPFPLIVSHAPPVPLCISSIGHDPFQYALFYFISDRVPVRVPDRLP